MSDMYEAVQEPGLTAQVNKQRSTRNNAVPTRRIAKGQLHLRVANGKRDLEALSSAISQWLVPLLIKEFLAEQIYAVGKIEATSSNRSSKSLHQEGAVNSAAFKKL
jgi:hypothetical protein